MKCIYNLKEYFDVIQKYNLSNYISRGESQKFDSIVSSSFRPYYYGSSKYFCQKEYDEFYNAIGNELTDMQKQHFLAFAQHCGLPTQLIDFTVSPLISLFFACCNDSKNMSGISNDIGFVHFINKARLIAIDSIIEKDYKAYMLNEIFKDDLKGKIGFFFLKLLYDNAKIDIQNDFKMCIDSLCKLIFEDEATKINNEIQTDYFNYNYVLDIFKAIKTLLDDQNIRESKFFANVSNVRDQINDIINSFEPNAPENTVLLLEILFWLIRHKAFDCEKCDQIITPFYLSYSPPNISSRIGMQNSIFIYQFHVTHFLESKNNYLYPEIYIQKISPDLTIQISNKNNILKELDTLGINLKTIYGDYDNTAKYIKNKFYMGLS